MRKSTPDGSNPDRSCLRRSGFPYAGDEISLGEVNIGGDTSRFLLKLEKFLITWGKATGAKIQPLAGSINTEIQFAQRVINQCKIWNQSGGVIFWDVDDTQGIGIHLPGQHASQWLARPSMPFLTSYIRSEFPNLKHGIFSRRSEETLKSDLAPNGRLSSYADFFSPDFVFSINNLPDVECSRFKLQDSKDIHKHTLQKAKGFMQVAEYISPVKSFLIDDYKYPAIEGLEGAILYVGDLTPKAVITPFSDAAYNTDSTKDASELMRNVFGIRRNPPTMPIHGEFQGKYWVQGITDPLSNFYPAPIVIDGERFGSVEAFIQTTKYKESDPFRERIRFLSGPSAKLSSKRSDRKYNKLCYKQSPTPPRHIYWKGKEILYGSTEHLTLIEKAIRTKFEQNSDAREALIATGSLPLHHDPATRYTYEKYGKLPRNHIFNKKEDAALPNKIFVSILEQIRKELLTQSSK